MDSNQSKQKSAGAATKLNSGMRQSAALANGLQAVAADSQLRGSDQKDLDWRARESAGCFQGAHAPADDARPSPSDVPGPGCEEEKGGKTKNYVIVGNYFNYTDLV